MREDVVKKGLITLGIYLILSAGMKETVYATDGADAVVVFNGSKTLAYSGFEEGGSFDGAFQEILPGEIRTLEIELSNTSGETANFYMDTQVLENLRKTTDNAAYHVKLEVKRGDLITVILGSDETAAILGGETQTGESRGLQELNDILSGYCMVACLADGEKAVVCLSVELDGESGDNTYQDQIGRLQFQFQAAYDDPETKTVVHTERESDRHEIQIAKSILDNSVTNEQMLNTLQNVRTGDGAPIAALIAAAFVSFGGFLLLLWSCFRRKR